MTARPQLDERDPLPPPECADCGKPLASPDELESGLCLPCLNGPVSSVTAEQAVTDDTRHAVASEMPKHMRQMGAGYEPACSCGWRGPLYVQEYMALGYIFRLHVADELLAVVAAASGAR